MPTASPTTPKKPADIQNGSFPPSHPGSPVNMEVLVFNVTDQDSLNISIEGSDFFMVSGGHTSFPTLVESPFELPNHVHPLEWEEDGNSPFDVNSPVNVSPDDRVHIFVAAGAPPEGALPGAFSGTLVVSGKTISIGVPLAGSLLGVAAKTPIGEKYESLGGAVFFGNTVGNAQPAPENKGTIQEFANGALWDTSQGVFYLSRAVYNKWVSPSVQSGPGLWVQRRATRWELLQKIHSDDRGRRPGFALSGRRHHRALRATAGGFG